MKHSVLSLFVAILFSISIVGCGSDSTTGPNVPEPWQMPFYAQVKNVAPVFEATDSPEALKQVQDIAATPGWDDGHPIKALFELLRDYEYPTDEGRIDSHNIYKVLYDCQATSGFPQ